MLARELLGDLFDHEFELLMTIGPPGLVKNIHADNTFGSPSDSEPIGIKRAG